ncbi:DUF6216 family protein [Pseudorhodoferax aquiterrae]|uniref:DUF6216 family protein n=1 Tax=Pseudorhodoferax aquiterrae TaxID=747304 RepID=UPI001673A33F|nr:DUF6216 family protein [Pseudorhodoferax aquiterrae]
MTTGDPTTLLSGVAVETWLAGEWKTLCLISAVVLSLLWVWWRTGSTHLLIMLLLRWLVGKRSDASSVVKFLEERTDLMHFRAVTGVRNAPTLPAAERIIQWSKRNDLDIDMVGRAHRYLDVRRPSLRTGPSHGWANWGLLCGLLLWLLAGFAALMGALAPPVLNVIKTDTPYLVDGERAWQFRWSGTPQALRFTRDDCAEPERIVEATQYAEYDVGVLCKLLLSEPRAYLRSVLRQQRVAAGIAALLAVFWGAQALLWVRSVRAVRALHAQMAADG